MEDRESHLFKAAFMQRHGLAQHYVSVSHCAVQLSALGAIMGSAASVDECERMVNDRPRHCQSISRVVWPPIPRTPGDKICVILP